MRGSKTHVSLRSSSLSSPGFRSSQHERDLNCFVPQKLGKIHLNSKQEVNSAKLYIQKDELVIKNLLQLEPLSHLISDEQIIELLGIILKRFND